MDTDQRHAVDIFMVRPKKENNHGLFVRARAVTVRGDRAPNALPGGEDHSFGGDALAAGRPPVLTGQPLELLTKGLARREAPGTHARGVAETPR
jgi:hypothetical protein